MDKPQLFSLIMNAGSGHREDGQAPVQDVLADYFAAQGVEFVAHIADDPAELDDLIQKAIRQHRQRDGVILAGGGDGTINAVAQRLLHSDIPMGIIPLGTFNYVARALDIPLDDPAAAAATALTGVARSVHVGQVNDRIYLNNASIGLYPYLIEQRERANKRFGRFRGVAMMSGLGVLMGVHEQMRLRMIVDGDPEPIASPMVFFGNNQLQLDDYNLQIADCAAQGKLAAIALQPVSRVRMMALLARIRLGTFEQAPEVNSYCAEKIRIESRQRLMKVAIDGEIVRLPTPLRFRVAQDALLIMVPADSPTAQQAGESSDPAAASTAGDAP